VSSADVYPSSRIAAGQLRRDEAIRFSGPIIPKNFEEHVGGTFRPVPRRDVSRGLQVHFLPPRSRSACKGILAVVTEPPFVNAVGDVTRLDRRASGRRERHPLNHLDLAGTPEGLHLGMGPRTTEKKIMTTTTRKESAKLGKKVTFVEHLIP